MEYGIWELMMENLQRATEAVKVYESRFAQLIKSSGAIEIYTSRSLGGCQGVHQSHGRTEAYTCDSGNIVARDLHRTPAMIVLT